MFKKFVDALISSKADRDVKHGLGIVRDHWMAYRSINPKPAEDEIVEYVSPFIVPMIAHLNAEPRWRGQPMSVALNLIFVVLIADAETQVGQDKLRAMRELLGDQHGSKE